MRVQLTTPRVGPLCTDRDGDVIDVLPDEGERLISSNQAIAVVETNMNVPPTRKGRSANLERRN